jgi:hemin uptake protein HemP
MALASQHARLKLPLISDFAMDSTPPTSIDPQADSAAVMPDTEVPRTEMLETAEIETRVMGSMSGTPHPTGPPHTLKVVRFENLACCGDEIWIENEGQLYRLRKTRQGKLILTK